RFINSAGSFSPDGRYFAIAAKHNDKDDLVILDVKKDEEVRRITVPLNGLITPRSEEHTSELQSLAYLVCRLLLEKKKKTKKKKKLLQKKSKNKKTKKKTKSTIK